MQHNTTFFLLDGHGVIFRSYYAHIRNPLRNSKNENTSAIFGFFQVVKKIFDVYAPEEFCIVFDHREPSFRKSIYSKYKANRQEAPEDLVSQIPIILRIVEALGIPTIMVPSVEADDVLATLATTRSTKGLHTAIVTSDKDIFQVLSEHTCIFRPSSKQTQWVHITPQWLKNEFSLIPQQIQDYLALVGDTSDNVPGVSGVGEKTALTLLQNYGSLANIYKCIDEIKPLWAKKLTSDKENAMLSYDLVRLLQDVPIPPMSFEYNNVLWDNAYEIFSEHEIFSFTKARGRISSSLRSSENAFKSSNNTLQESSLNTSLHTKGLYHCVKSLTDIDKIVEQALAQKYISIDVETSSLCMFTADIVGISLSVTEGEGYYIPLIMSPPDRHEAEREGTILNKAHVKAALQPLFEDEVCTLIFHNCKFDIPFLSRWGLVKNPRAKNPFFDTLLASWLCDVTLRNYAMNNLARHFLSYNPISFRSLRAYNEIIELDKKNNKAPSNFADVPLRQAVDYSAEDADVTLRLYMVLCKLLRKSNMESLFYSLEMPISDILMRMELCGIEINTHYLSTLSKEFTHMQETLKQEIYEMCGETFNINSTKQLQKVLFEDLKLPTLKKNATGFSTDASVLADLAYIHPVPQKIVKYRHVVKLQNTYIDSLPKQIQEKTRRIHTSFLQHGTETGRLSSVSPNLQNIPIKDVFGQKIRNAFVAPEGSIFISADYSQIELIVLAHLSQDENLMQAFFDNVDIHKRTAAILMKKKEDEINDEQRRIAKSINFGIIYGMSAFRLANQLRISQKDAREFIDDYFIQFQGISKFIEDTEKATEELGYAETILKRRRIIPTIRSTNKNLQNAAKRMAVNTVIQGSAADIVKCAMLSLDKALRARDMKSMLILQIHDELVLECPLSEHEDAKYILEDTMKNAYTLSVPLSVFVHSGSTWGELK